MEFNEKLRKLRKEKGLSQEELADIIGVSRQALSKWESGSSYPEMEKLIALSGLFGVTIDSLVKDSDLKKRGRNRELAHSINLLIKLK
jgi:transcriptional regulator with XRE-family HTH domain